MVVDKNGGIEREVEKKRRAHHESRVEFNLPINQLMVIIIIIITVKGKTIPFFYEVICCACIALIPSNQLNCYSSKLVFRLKFAACLYRLSRASYVLAFNSQLLVRTSRIDLALPLVYF